MTTTKLIAILEKNNADIKERRFHVKGEIQALNEELTTLDAKESHNRELISLLRNDEDEDTPVTAREE